MPLFHYYYMVYDVLMCILQVGMIAMYIHFAIEKMVVNLPTLTVL